MASHNEKAYRCDYWLANTPFANVNSGFHGKIFDPFWQILTGRRRARGLEAQ